MLAGLLLPAPPQRAGGGGALWITQILMHFTHVCILKAEGCAQTAEDEVLSGFTALNL